VLTYYINWEETIFPQYTHNAHKQKQKPPVRVLVEVKGVNSFSCSNNGNKTLSTQLLSETYPTKENSLKGMLVCWVSR
jgi:hypothetical protein